MKAFLNLKLDILKSTLIYEFNLDMKQASKCLFFKESDGNMFWNEVHLVHHTWGHLLKKKWRNLLNWKKLFCV